MSGPRQVDPPAVPAESADGERPGMSAAGHDPAPLERSNAEHFHSVVSAVRERTGVDLSEARVRAGFTRGHLLEVVVALTEAHAENAEWAAELAVDALVGVEVSEDWIATIDVVSIPRVSMLRVVQDERPTAETYALQELPLLMQRAVEAVDGNLPCHRRWERPLPDDWVMFEVDAIEDGPHEGRALASTAVPEAMKCSLEGMPFSSRRFSRWGEWFVSLRIPLDDASLRFADERMALRAEREELLDAALRCRKLGAVIGTGAGLDTDFLDLCVEGTPQALLDVLAVGASLGLPRRTLLVPWDGRHEAIGAHAAVIGS